MAKYKFEARLNEQSMRQLAKDLKTYRTVTLENKIKRFLNELSDIGIVVAYTKVNSTGKNGTDKYSNYISFTKKVEVESQSVYVGYMIGQADMKGDLKPLSMVEWGSAKFADKPSSRFGGSGGKGTWATKGHENDEKWIYFDTTKNAWRTNHSVKPTRPMMNAANHMYLQVERIAKRVF